MGENRPAVSVIIPAYQVAPWIGATLESVVAQTKGDLEILVVNDGSPDTPALEQALAPFRGRIRYLTQDNRGAAAARNAALAKAAGAWVGFLDGDDRWLPDYLARQLAVAESRHLDMVWCNGYAIDASGRRTGELMRRSPSQGPVTVASLLRGQVNVFTSATMVRRARLEAAGGFDETLRRAQDFDLWVRLVNAGVRAGYHREPLVEYRSRQGNLSGDEASQVERAITVMQHLRTTVPLNAADVAVLERRLGELERARLMLAGRLALLDGRYAEAAEQIRAAHDRAPSLRGGLILRLVTIAPALARWLLRQRTGGAAGARP